MESESKKYELICCFGWKPLLLENLVLYVYIDSKKDGKTDDVEIAEREVESPPILSLPQLCSGFHAVESLYVALVEPPKSWFAASSGLSDIEHIYRYACAIIFIEKDISFSPGFHCLNTLSLPVLTLEVVNKVACCYSRFFWNQSMHSTQYPWSKRLLDSI